jgi:hypothetical protein
MSPDAPKSAFIAAWPGGYQETFSNYLGASEKLVVARFLAPFFNRAHVAVELGSGRGFWALRHLMPNFARVFCVDVIPCPPELSKAAVTYIELPDRTFDVPLRDASVDFVWSFGMFCHLSGAACRAYLRGVYRILKPERRAVLMFGNTSRLQGLPYKPLRDEKEGDVRYDQHPAGWFFCDQGMVAKWASAAGFRFTDMMPSFRDTMALLEK